MKLEGRVAAVTGGSAADQEYDLSELRKKLEKRMEYQLVSNIQTDTNRARRTAEAADASCPSYHSTPMSDDESAAQTN